MKWWDSSGSPLEAGHMFLVFRGMLGSWMMPSSSISLSSSSFSFIREVWSRRKSNSNDDPSSCQPPTTHAVLPGDGRKSKALWEGARRWHLTGVWADSLGTQGKNVVCICNTAFGLGSRIPKVTLWLGMTQPCFSFPADITWAIPHCFQNKCPQSKDIEKIWQFPPSGGPCLLQRDLLSSVQESPTSPFPLSGSQRTQQKYALCVLSTVSLTWWWLQWAVAKLGRGCFSIRKELVCTRFTQELNGRGTGKEGSFFIFKKKKQEQRTDSIVAMGWVQHVN